MFRMVDMHVRSISSISAMPWMRLRLRLCRSFWFVMLRNWLIQKLNLVMFSGFELESEEFLAGLISKHDVLLLFSTAYRVNIKAYERRDCDLTSIFRLTNSLVRSQEF